MFIIDMKWPIFPEIRKPLIRLSDESLHAARSRRKKEKAMFKAVKKCSATFLFLWIIYSLTFRYSLRQTFTYPVQFKLKTIGSDKNCNLYDFISRHKNINHQYENITRYNIQECRQHKVTHIIPIHTQPRCFAYMHPEAHTQTQ